MRFEWQRFVDTNGIDFESGVAKNNIHIDCPFCPDGRGRRHMGLHLGSSAYGCFKSGAHRSSKNPAKLVAALLGCSWSEARSIVNDQDWVSDDFASMRERFERLGAPSPAAERLQRYTLPRDLFPLWRGGQQCRPFLNYLDGRGLPVAAAEKYRLYGATTGEYRGRVVAPFLVKGMTIAATGRHIGRHKQRYHTRPDGAVDKTVFNYDIADSLAEDSDALVIVEGPFDAMILDWLFETLGLQASAVALAGLGYGQSKRAPILELACHYQRVIVLLDRGAEGEAFRIQEDLQGARVPTTVKLMPMGVDDPGEFKAQHALQILEPRAA